MVDGSSLNTAVVCRHRTSSQTFLERPHFCPHGESTTTSPSTIPLTIRQQTIFTMDMSGMNHGSGGMGSSKPACKSEPDPTLLDQP